ncbi:Lipoprotein YcfM, part of a salvage pathway of unknown substrate [Candidatus Palibaumannia cicadellinicola]|uniref:Penicillin-binding protein activator LpoB n=2 Tax=Candidatus Palibaumannia cicadellinicola TaxID=186490 RepID=A0A0K2BL97_9GAMM|nr:Lipoprotein YcfM, part of a salvage pathway of unknown substrate [Candidatus Baumannia cicadellinicola]
MLLTTVSLLTYGHQKNKFFSNLPTNELVQMPPKFKYINWEASLSPLVNNMMLVDGIRKNSLLLVNTIKNNTNGSLKSGQATTMLRSLIAAANSEKFTLIRVDTIKSARINLGLSYEDSLESRSKAIALARYLKAQYVLYSTANGDIKKPELDMQLMLVNTGEIVWDGKGIIIYSK